jgi:phage/plasmid primase-like uncharacterized protein
MATISGTVGANTVITVVGASGDGANVAAKFNGVTFKSISNTAATATNSSGTVTITWPSSSMLCSDAAARQFVTNTLAADTSLTSPITVSAATLGSLVA